MKKFQTGYMAGVYDLFHIGHLNLINNAKENCKFLIVGVLTDELVYYFKKKYPVIPFEERIKIIGAIKGVDKAVPVTIENIGKMESWQLYHYDVQFSGSDYENAPDWLEDKRRLEEVGSTIMFFPYTNYTSSTDIRKKLLASIEEADKEQMQYHVSDKMKQIWQTELSILDSIDAICRKNNIKYFAMNGTLLGAVRHNGFIPWDDDLDIGMLRDDYNHFIEAASRELPDYMFLQTLFSDPCIFNNGITRVRDSRTTGIEEHNLNHPSNQGIWVDIIPIDYSSADDKLFRKKSQRVGHFNLLMQAKVYGNRFGVKAFNKSMIVWMGYRVVAKFLTYNWIAKKLDQAMQQKEKDDEKLSIFTGYTKFRQLHKADFVNTVELDFCGRKITAPVGYKNYLFMIMGSDYMKYPPENERKPKHRGIFDANRPYGDYIKLFCGMFDNVVGKQIIVFGAGMMFDDFMLKFGNQYRPYFIVDNDRNKWGRIRQGVEIKSPEEILKIPASKRKIIICSAYYPEIEKQLQQMNIVDYSIYIQHIEWIMDTEKNR